MDETPVTLQNSQTDTINLTQGGVEAQKPPEIPTLILPWYVKYKTVLIIAGVIATIIVGSLVFQTAAPKKISLPPIPTPTLYPTPTPDRKLSPLSGLQEFRDLDAEVSSLSAHLDSVSLDDPSLVPPTLTLPLGFQN
jgi:hypothetical protein